MAANASSITKFRALSHLDEWSADPVTRPAVYRAALDRLNDPAFDLLGETVAGVETLASSANDPDHPLTHLREHWLAGSYFPNIDEAVIRATLRDGFRDAIRAALEADLPLNSVWIRVSHDSNHDDFRVDHVVGPTAVTVAIISPAPDRATRT
jgi:hypothetical protein